MRLRQFARALGHRGGLVRAQRLSPDRRRKIASLGGRARRESLQAGRRIEENFRYLDVVRTLAKTPKVVPLRTIRHKLPGIHG